MVWTQNKIQYCTFQATIKAESQILQSPLFFNKTSHSIININVNCNSRKFKSHANCSSIVRQNRVFNSLTPEGALWAKRHSRQSPLARLPCFKKINMLLLFPIYLFCWFHTFFFFLPSFAKISEGNNLKNQLDCNILIDF